MKATTFELATGLFGQVLEGNEAFFAANAGDGWWWVPGEFDARCQRLVALHPDGFGDAFAVVEDWRPPAPAATEWETWEWDAGQKRYAPVPTRAALEFQARRRRDELMAATIGVSLKAVRTGEPIPPDWAAYMQALADVPSQPGFPTAIDWPQPPSP